MGQTLKKLGSEDKKEIGPIIENCYDTYLANTNTDNLALFYHAVFQTIEEINKMIGSTQFRVPSTETLEQVYNNHHKEKGEALTKEEFKKILQKLIIDTGLTGMGIKDIFLFIFGIPIAAVFIKQRTVPNAIPNDVFIPGVTSATVFLLAKLNKI